MKRVIFYTNQFFGQIGGEDQADVPPQVREEVIGPANLFKDHIGGEIVATIICGDNYYAQNMETARAFVYQQIEKYKPQLVIAGPAFNAGRFGMACGDICASIEGKYNIPTLTGLYAENPAVDIYKDKTYIAETGNSAAAMRKAVPLMVKLANKLLNGEKLGLPKEEGYIPKGIRMNIFKEKTGAERALDMLINKLSGKPYETEVPIPEYEAIQAAKAVADLSKAKIALLTSGGVVPKGNADHLPAATAKFWMKYDIRALDSLNGGEYESVHAGFDPVYANDNPNRIVPLDIMRRLEKKRKIGSLYDYFIVTTGNSTSVADATRMGKEIAEELKKAGVDAAIMTST
ncbi:sarcosine reductase [Geosporobacter ferrireducens]|uniref:Sarcosine reductase n=2 Tax=Geosporobacter ferrireducens TaxID=1424294 RepID=A0A1D8GE73_9FIRM|nr:sarcosine reductase [Geosporobacter ferrireducens]